MCTGRRSSVGALLRGCLSHPSYPKDSAQSASHRRCPSPIAYRGRWVARLVVIERALDGNVADFVRTATRRLSIPVFHLLSLGQHLGDDAGAATTGACRPSASTGVGSASPPGRSYSGTAEGRIDLAAASRAALRRRAWQWIEGGAMGDLVEAVVTLFRRCDVPEPVRHCAPALSAKHGAGKGVAMPLRVRSRGLRRGRALRLLQAYGVYGATAPSIGPRGYGGRRVGLGAAPTKIGQRLLF